MCNISVACTVTSHKTSQRAVVLDHHIFDDRNDWITRRSTPQSTVFLTARAHTKDYEKLGYRLCTWTRQITIAMTADTGFQSVLVGIKIIHRLSFKKLDLILVETKISAVKRDIIPISGAVILRLSGKLVSGKIIETAQICYVTDLIEGAYLSRAACTTLEIINHPNRLPANRISHSATHVSQFRCIKPTRRGVRLLLPHTHRATTITNCFTIRCNRRQRSRSPELDTRQIPFQIFQHLRMPNTPSDRRPAVGTQRDPEAKTIAVHKPIPVPLHWQQEVKASIDRYVKLGVLEAVAVGEPVTWCHRMVTPRKKNGKPRRTVDMQVLNKHAVRETHHTQRPFHQATRVPSML